MGNHPIEISPYPIFRIGFRTPSIARNKDLVDKVRNKVPCGLLIAYV